MKIIVKKKHSGVKCKGRESYDQSVWLGGGMVWKDSRGGGKGRTTRWLRILCKNLDCNAEVLVSARDFFGAIEKEYRSNPNLLEDK